MGWREYIAWGWISVSSSPHTPEQKFRHHFCRSQDYIQMSTRGDSNRVGTRISASQHSRKYLQKHRFKQPFSWSSLHRTMKGPWKCKSPWLFPAISQIQQMHPDRDWEQKGQNCWNTALSRIKQKYPRFPNASPNDWTIRLQIQTRNLLSSSQC